MKRLTLILLSLLMLLTACTPADRGVIKQENIPERLENYSVASAKNNPIVFQSDVFGTVSYQLEDVEYLDKLPTTFELRDDGLYHVGVKLDDDQGLTEYLYDKTALGDIIGEDESGPIYDTYKTTNLSSEITIVKVEMTITRTAEGNLPDFDANDEFPLDCLKIYVGLNGNNYSGVYTPLAVGGSNVTYSDNIKLKTEIPTSVTLYYAVKTKDFRHSDVCLSVQIAEVADLRSKDISFITLVDTQLISISTKNGNNGTIEGDGYFGIRYNGDIYYITDDYTSVSSKYNDNYSGVGIYKQQEGDDEEIQIISNTFLADKGFFDALYHNGVIYFALRDVVKLKNDRDHSQDSDIILFSYDFENGVLRALYTFSMGTEKYFQMKYTKNGFIYFNMRYYKDYSKRGGPTLVDATEEEWEEYLKEYNANTVYESFAINPKNKRIYRVNNYGGLKLLFGQDQVEFIGTGPRESMKTIYTEGMLIQRVDDVTVYNTLEETGIQVQGDYDEDTHFLLANMTVSYANPGNIDDTCEYEFDLIATTHPEMAEIALNTYPIGAQAPEIIYVDDMPEILPHGEKYTCRVLIAAHKDYVANRDIFLAETLEPPMSSLSPKKQFIQLINTQIIEYTEQPVNIFGLTAWGYHDIEYKGSVYSYTNTVKTDISGEKYAYYTDEGYAFGSDVFIGEVKDKALFSSCALMDEGYLYYATKSNTANQGHDFKEWTDGRIQIFVEYMDSTNIDPNMVSRVICDLDPDPTVTDIRPLEVKDGNLIFEIYRTVDGVETVEKYSAVIEAEIPPSLNVIVPVE